MKKWVKILTMFVALILAGCKVSCANDTSTEDSPLLLSFGTEVLPDIYDDGQSTIYIKANNPQAGEEDTAVADIMTKKMRWEQQFPTKKVITMSIVTGDGGALYGYTAVLGLLIHYERR
jgi:hypothetical protein